MSPRRIVTVALICIAVIAFIFYFVNLKNPSLLNVPGEGKVGLFVAMLTLILTFFQAWGDLTDVLSRISSQAKKAKSLKKPPRGKLLPPGDGTLPAGSRLIHSQNLIFTGREADLFAVVQHFFYPKITEKAHQALILTGLGGVGKTQTAVEFSYRYHPYFNGVYWIQADQSIEAEIANCGREMGLEAWPEELPDQVAATLRTWNQPERRNLIVLDNLEDISLFRNWISRLGNAFVLVTSRRRDWPVTLGVKVHLLGQFTPAESVAFLCKLAPRLTDFPEGDLKQVADRLGYLPLALHLAGSYLNKFTSLTPKNYLAEIKREGGLMGQSHLPPSMMDNPTRHIVSLRDTYHLSWKQMDENEPVDALARFMLSTAGYCAPGVLIPVEILQNAALVKDGFSETNNELDENRTALLRTLELALERLYDLGLLDRGQGGIIIHPLLAEFARFEDRTAPSHALPVLVRVLVRLTMQACDSRLPEQFKPLRAHVQAAAEAAEQALSQPASQEEAGQAAEDLSGASTLWNNLGLYLRRAAEYKGARTCYERALKLDEAACGENHPYVARDIHNLGLVLRALGDLEGARNCHERALKIDEPIFGPDHPFVASVVSSLGLVLQDMDDFQGARDCYERALRIYEANGGKQDARVATQLNNLGGVLYELGDLSGARRNLERALAIDEAISPDRPAVASDLNSLGVVLHRLGDLEGAQDDLERAVKIDEAHYGLDHPTIARDVYNLGGVYQDQGEPARARQCFERALKIWEKTLPPGHAKIIAVREKLAQVR